MIGQVYIVVLTTNGNDTLQVDAQKREAQLITLQHGETNNGYLPSWHQYMSKLSIWPWI